MQMCFIWDVGRDIWHAPFFCRASGKTASQTWPDSAQKSMDSGRGSGTGPPCRASVSPGGQRLSCATSGHRGGRIAVEAAAHWQPGKTYSERVPEVCRRATITLELEAYVVRLPRGQTARTANAATHAEFDDHALLPCDRRCPLVLATRPWAPTTVRPQRARLSTKVQTKPGPSPVRVSPPIAHPIPQLPCQRFTLFLFTAPRLLAAFTSRSVPLCAASPRVPLCN
ncbi:hypothetical protein P154DRAFT_581342 [Amniculicola lignicola CBS 123094]|uniref:Uncharacterized protein n=1 Tax=Amniculicola lignicola CBS 123094 TaxID=1392246 RepID=A0A6A5W710_9PLEO|nr:hypothetical protein P154DRAFT_581342 [Amniculicola lignicola CBS 123094]